MRKRDLTIAIIAAVIGALAFGFAVLIAFELLYPY